MYQLGGFGGLLFAPSVEVVQSKIFTKFSSLKLVLLSDRTCLSSREFQEPRSRNLEKLKNQDQEISRKNQRRVRPAFLRAAGCLGWDGPGCRPAHELAAISNQPLCLVSVSIAFFFTKYFFQDFAQDGNIFFKILRKSEQCRLASAGCGPFGPAKNGCEPSPHLPLKRTPLY